MGSLLQFGRSAGPIVALKPTLHRRQQKFNFPTLIYLISCMLQEILE